MAARDAARAFEADHPSQRRVPTRCQRKTSEAGRDDHDGLEALFGWGRARAVDPGPVEPGRRIAEVRHRGRGRTVGDPRPPGGRKRETGRPVMPVNRPRPATGSTRAGCPAEGIRRVELSAKPESPRVRGKRSWPARTQRAVEVRAVINGLDAGQPPPASGRTPGRRSPHEADAKPPRLSLVQLGRGTRCWLRVFQRGRSAAASQQGRPRAPRSSLRGPAASGRRERSHRSRPTFQALDSSW
jgi:hypothetical protein